MQSTTQPNGIANDIIAFWFGQPADPDYGRYRKAWFIKDADFDADIRQHFLSDVEKAANGDYNDWQAGDSSAVALLLLLDQFPRNLYRGDPRSFATDSKALSVARGLVDSGRHLEMILAHRFFVYVPFEHSEEMANQDRCVALMRSLNQEFPNLEKGLAGGLDYAIRHRDIIERFGRFPHRNEILGRESTPEEQVFLQQPGSRF
ncbi:MAG: DUF924 family protein [Cyanobacteria bacterium P01_C01_bin.69]